MELCLHSLTYLHVMFMHRDDFIFTIWNKYTNVCKNVMKLKSGKTCSQCVKDLLGKISDTQKAVLHMIKV